MGEFLKEHLESIMMISFVLATAFGMYKVYVMFEKQSDEGIDIKTLEDEIITIIEKILKTQDSLSKEKLFEKIQSDTAFDKERHFNFNQNRLNQILDRLHIHYKTQSYEELKEKIREKI